jgi:hypothetical protein
VYESAEARFPGSGFRTLGGVIFLRLFCPAIVAPEAYNLASSPVPPHVRRSLILVAKLLQNLVNEILFEKEEYMLDFNPWIQENVATIHASFLRWVQDGSQSPADQESPPSSPHAVSTTISESWALSSSSSSDGGSLDQPCSGMEAIGEEDIVAIERGLKECMQVLRAYDGDRTVVKAIKSLDLRYKEVKQTLRALWESSHSPLLDTGGLAGDMISGSASWSSFPTRPRALSSPRRSVSEDELGATGAELEAKGTRDRKGSLIERIKSGRMRSGSRGSAAEVMEDLRQTDVVRWDRKRVLLWLQALELDEAALKEYELSFKKRNVTGLKLQQITREDLVDIGVKRLGDRKKLLTQSQALYRERVAAFVATGVREWTAEDVAVWLGANELVEYQEQWLKDGVDGQVLLEAMDSEYGLQRLNVSKCGHRKKIVRLVREATSA